MDDDDFLGQFKTVDRVGQRIDQHCKRAKPAVAWSVLKVGGRWYAAAETATEQEAEALARKLNLQFSPL